MTPPVERPPAGAAVTPSQQICITHCLYEEGLYRQAGFGVRACSTRDPLLLRFALEYPPFELPLDMQGGVWPSRATPRRLALVRIPGGKSALIHSVLLPEEERGRANNFFSHVLVRPALTPREALATWGSPDWMTGLPAGAGTDLPPFEGLPRPGPVNDQAVTAFLQPEAAFEDQDLATLLCPERLAREDRRRRQLLCLALRGCLLALQAGPASPRGRFYLLAEPGLTALLLYAAVRLLPQALTANLTFSTYEHLQRDLRPYKHAQVVGTYTADPKPGLPEGFFTARGYALDTFSNDFSDEMAADGDLPVEGWVDLAARGDWEAVDRVYGLLGKGSTSVVSVKEGAQAAGLAGRLESGQAGADDLLALRRAAWGRPVLEQHRAQVWAVVRGAGGADARLRAEFADVIAEHLPELEQSVALALASPAPADWQPHWRLLCSALAADHARLREILLRVVPEPPYAPGLRVALLRELQQARLSPLNGRLPLQRLLRHCSAAELDDLGRADLPREWLALALCYALVSPQTQAEAARRLRAGDDDLVRTFGEQVKAIKDEGQRRAVLAPLFPAADPQAGDLLGRLLRRNCGLRPDTLAWLLQTVGAWQRDWHDFWARDHHLKHLLDILREFGADGRPLWDRLCGQIDQEVLMAGDTYQPTLLRELATLKDAPAPPFGPDAAQAVADWVLLCEHFEAASAVAGPERQAILDACDRRRLDATGVLARYFDRFVRPQGMNEAVLADFVGFFHSFYSEPATEADHARRAADWARVVSVCATKEERAGYQDYHLEQCVPPDLREQVAAEVEKAYEFLPPVASRPFGPPASPAGPTAGEEVFTDDEFPLVESDDERAPASDESLFLLTGVEPAPADTLPLRAAAVRLGWLLCMLAGGLLAAFVTRLHLQPLARLTVLVMFAPLVVMMAEGMAAQAVAAGLLAWRGSDQGRRGPRQLLLEFALGVVLGVVCGLVTFAVLAVVRWPVREAACVGGAVAGGLAGGTVVGLLLAILASTLRRGPRLAAGPLARALAGPTALLLFFTLALVLLPSTPKAAPAAPSNASHPGAPRR
jgi:hypothetical protein